MTVWKEKCTKNGYNEIIEKRYTQKYPNNGRDEAKTNALAAAITRSYFDFFKQNTNWISASVASSKQIIIHQIVNQSIGYIRDLRDTEIKTYKLDNDIKTEEVKTLKPPKQTLRIESAKTVPKTVPKKVTTTAPKTVTTTVPKTVPKTTTKTTSKK